MKKKTCKRITAVVTAFAMAGMSLLADLGGYGLFDNFSVTARAEGVHTITLEASVGNALTADKSTAAAGETVTLTAGANYWINTITIKCGDNTISATNNNNGTFSFTMPDGDVSVSAGYQSIYYFVDRQWNSTEKKVDSVETDIAGQTLHGITSQTTSLENNVYYYVSSDTTISERVTVNGTASIILRDGTTLNCQKGIAVNAGATLNIYGQKLDAGKLIAGSESYNAAIGSDDQDTTAGADGCGTINIYGGIIEATSGTDAAGIGGGNEARHGNINIYGGDITATSENLGSGIGSGDKAETTGGTITIYGGKITATGGDYGAGIGGGYKDYAGNIVIKGGKVTAKGGKKAAGIGTGYEPSRDDKSLGNITIDGGEIESTGGDYAAGIGGGAGEHLTGGSITINGGSVTAKGGECGAAGIGSGYNVDCGFTISINGGYVDVWCKQYSGAADGNPDEGGAGIGAAAAGDLTGTINITGGTVKARGGGEYRDAGGQIVPSFGATWYYGGAGIGCGFEGNITETGSINISGGNLIVTGDYGAAAIGAGAEMNVGQIGGECEGTIRITGGKILLKLYSYDQDCVFVGHGCDGSTDGTLVLGHNMRVNLTLEDTDSIEFVDAENLKADGNESIIASSRTNTLRSRNWKRLYISECTHPDKTYTITASSHTANCAYCSTSFTAESHTLDSNNKCTVCGYQGQLNSVSYVSGSSLTLKGDIGANVYIKPSADLDNSAYVTVKGPNDSEAVTYTLTSLPLDETYGRKITCMMNAKQMGENVEIHLFDGNNDEQTIYYSNMVTAFNNGYYFSPKDYFATVKGNNTFSTELRALCLTMENYGEYAREYFGNKNEVVCTPTEITDVTVDTLASYRTAITGTAPEGVSFYGSSLLLGSKTSLRFYFDSEITGFTVKDADNESVAYTSGMAKGKFYIEVPDISADDLDKNYTVSVGDYSVASSALTYAYNTLYTYGNNSEKTALCNVVKALYKYNAAAKEYATYLANQQ